jgi:hypothetical protein
MTVSHPLLLLPHPPPTPLLVLHPTPAAAVVFQILGYTLLLPQQRLLPDCLHHPCQIQTAVHLLHGRTLLLPCLSPHSQHHRLRCLLLACVQPLLRTAAPCARWMLLWTRS